MKFKWTRSLTWNVPQSSLYFFHESGSIYWLLQVLLITGFFFFFWSSSHEKHSNFNFKTKQTANPLWESTRFAQIIMTFPVWSVHFSASLWIFYFLFSFCNNRHTAGLLFCGRTDSENIIIIIDSAAFSTGTDKIKISPLHSFDLLWTVLRVWHTVEHVAHRVGN